MEKEFIPYQKALRLKELGFNESDSLGFHMLNPTDIRGDSVRLWSEYEKGDKISCNAITWQTAFRFVLGIIYSDSKLKKKFNKKYFLDFTENGFNMDNRELAQTYESDEETLGEIISFINLNLTT
jgi:hypothetical protein